ncbi:MAG: hypothetical protein ISR58_10020 [Anaerolineales bacterium]|nr:hypothetical protein [Chloroflexota bacterium]MBL6981510.1 hypothetical protein [Anaerolineales bacterium]
MLILNSEEVRKALPMDAAIQAIKSAYAALSSGVVEMPLRAHLSIISEEAVSLIMPAYVQAKENALAVKVVSVFPNNHERNLPRINAAVLVLDAKTGVPQALLEGGMLTAIRTGAASGASIDILSRPDSKTAAIFGAGVQGRTQLEAVCTARSIETAWIFDLDSNQAAKFVEEMSGQGSIPDDLRVAPTPEEAIAEADIICTATTSTSPVFPEQAVRAGTHISGVGSYTLEMIEVPPEITQRAHVFVDSRQAIMDEAGELVAAIKQGFINQDAFIELGDVINGVTPGREDADKITFFKSVGVAVQDAMAAQLALSNARKLGLGQEVEW